MITCLDDPRSMWTGPIKKKLYICEHRKEQSDKVYKYHRIKAVIYTATVAFFYIGVQCI